MRTPIGFILLIIIPASLIITMEIRNIVKEVTKTRRKVSHHKGGKADAESLFFKEAGYAVVVGEKVERAVENC